MNASKVAELRGKLFELYQLSPVPTETQLKMIADIIEYYDESMHQGWELSMTPEKWVEAMVDLVTYIVLK